MLVGTGVTALASKLGLPELFSSAFRQTDTKSGTKQKRRDRSSQRTGNTLQIWKVEFSTSSTLRPEAERSEAK